MIVLPIVGRELLVASRRRGTYWLRVLAAAVALVFCGITLITLHVTPSFTAAGGRIFMFLSWVGLAFALLSGVQSTADCLSRERREETLGLLFLTDLKGYDVVLGKLTVASLTVFYGIVAMLPILALPLMLGGVTPGEYARVALVWLNSLFFSVAAGMAVSSLARDERIALGNSFALVLGVTLALPLGGLLISQWTGSPTWSEVLALISPLPACHLAFQTNYVTYAWGYWISLGVTHVFAWACLGLACASARHAWHGKPVSPRKASDARAHQPARTAAGTDFRRYALRLNPVFWLLSRQRIVRWYPWILLATIVGIGVWGAYLGRPMMTMHATLFAGYAGHFLFKWWVATVACRSFDEERENGSLELLLSTPLTVKEILRGVRWSMIRLFGWPIVVLVLLQLFAVVASWRPASGDADLGGLSFMVLANVAVFLLDCWALQWTGLLAGLRSRNPQAVWWKTMLTVLGLPWLGVWGFLALTLFLKGQLPFEESGVTVALVCFSVAVDLFFGLRAKLKLQRQLRTVTLERLTEGRRERFAVGSVR